MGLKNMFDDYISSKIRKAVDEYNDVISGKLIENNRSVVDIREHISYDQFIYLMEFIRRGDIYEICQAASGVMTDTQSFWGTALSTRADSIILKHDGVDAIITSKIIDMVMALYTGFQDNNLNDEEKAEAEQVITDFVKNNYNDAYFEKFMRELMSYVLYFGDVVVLPYRNMNNDIKLKFEYGRNVKYITDRNDDIVSVIVVKHFEDNNKKYTFTEEYSKGSIKYRIYNDKEEEQPLSLFPEYSDVKDIEFKDKTINTFWIIKFYTSKKYKNRGASIFESKLDYLDSLDEVVSLRQTTLVDATPKILYPDSYIARKQDGSTDLKKTRFNRFFKFMDGNGDGKIESIQMEMAANDYKLTEYDLRRKVFEGVLNESELNGSQAVNNTAIQNSQERTTSYTVNSLSGTLSNVFSQIIFDLLRINDSFGKISLPEWAKNEDYEILFDEYGSPTFADKINQSAVIHQNNLMPNYERLVILFQGLKTDDEIRAIADECDQLDFIQNAGKYAIANGDYNGDGVADNGTPAKDPSKAVKPEQPDTANKIMDRVQGASRNEGSRDRGDNKNNFSTF